MSININPKIVNINARIVNINPKIFHSKKCKLLCRNPRDCMFALFHSKNCLKLLEARKLDGRLLALMHGFTEL